MYRSLAARVFLCVFVCVCVYLMHETWLLIHCNLTAQDLLVLCLCIYIVDLT